MKKIGTAESFGNCYIIFLKGLCRFHSINHF